MCRPCRLSGADRYFLPATAFPDSTLEPLVIFVFDPVHRDVRTSSYCEIEGLCFIVTITCMQTGHERAAVVECAYELRHYLLTAENVSIKHIQLMSPPSVSGRSHWALEELERIVIYNDVGANQNAVVYQTSNTAYKLGDLDLRKKKTTRVLYAAQFFQMHEAEATVPPPVMSSPRLFASL